MIFEELGKKKQSSIMTSIITMAIGILLIICPEPIIGSLVAALGYAMLIYAFVQILTFLTGKKALINYVYLTGALIVALLGFAVLVTHNVIFIIGLVFGLFLILSGIHGIFITVMYIRHAGRKGWPVLIALSVVLILLGVVLLINPWWATAPELIDTIGIMMLIAAATSIVRLYYTWPIREA